LTEREGLTSLERDETNVWSTCEPIFPLSLQLLFVVVVVTLQLQLIMWFHLPTRRTWAI